MAEQNYSNHARYYAPFHFVVMPLLLVHLVWTLYRLWQNPDLVNLEALVLAAALYLLAFVVRMHAVKVQDRVIWLEERLRYERILPAGVAARALDLPPSQIVALRFASDGELADRVMDVLEGRVTKASDIKKSIRTWRPDTFRV